jgi:hypothetical protein
VCSHRATGRNCEKVWLKQWVKRRSSAMAAATERSPPTRRSSRPNGAMLRYSRRALKIRLTALVHSFQVVLRGEAKCSR